MEKIQRDKESVIAAISDIRVYADGIENALVTNKLKDIEHYINDIKVLLETISEYVEAENK